MRDLAWADLRCVLQVVCRRFKCAACRRPFTETLVAVAPYARTTTRYAAPLRAAVRTATVAQVARAEHHGFVAVEGIVYRQARATHPLGPSTRRITRLGRDEIAARQGPGHYKRVLVDLETHQVVDQLADRDKAALRAYCGQWSAEARAAVAEVTTDFWAA